MPHDPHQHDDPLEGHLFWSRRGGRDLSAEVDYDRPCPVCGYNQRGMPIKSRCPECGSVGGWQLDDEPIDWDDRQTFGSFIVSCWDAIFHPHWLARHIWRQERMDLNAARRFRRITITIASVCLSFAAFMLTQRYTDVLPALLCLPFQTMAIVVWLNAVTLEPLKLTKEWSTNSAISRRVLTIVHYASAALALAPLHVVLVLILNANTDVPWLLAAAMHVSLLMLQLFLAAFASGWLIYELVDMPRMQAHSMALGPVISATASAAIILVGVSAMVALLASRIVGV